MFSKNKKWVASILTIVLAALACNLPQGNTETGESANTLIPSPTLLIASDTPTATTAPAIADPSSCTPAVTATTLVNIRNGPGQEYAILGNLQQGTTANVSGKNQDGSWWYIEFQGSYAWVSAEVTTPACIPATLAIIASPEVGTAAPTSAQATTITDPQPIASGSVTPTVFVAIIPPGALRGNPTATPTYLMAIPPGGFPILPGP